MGMKPELVLDEEGISQRFKYVKARTARGGSESGELEASSSSAEVTPSPLTEGVTRLNLEPGPFWSGLGSVRASTSPGRGGLSQLSDNEIKVSPGKLWPVHQNPQSSFHPYNGNVSRGTDWFIRQNQSQNFIRTGLSPESSDWFLPPPENVLEERTPVQPGPIRVSVIRSNPNTSAPPTEPSLREQGNFILPTPLPVNNPSYYTSRHATSKQKSCQNSFHKDVELQVAVDLSSQHTWEDIIRRTRMEKNDTYDTMMNNQEALMKGLSADLTMGSTMELSHFEEITEGVATSLNDPLPDKMIEHYLHKKFRKIVNSNNEDMEDSTDEVFNGLVSTMPPNKNQFDIDFEFDSPISVSSLLLHIDAQEYDLMFINDLEKVFLHYWRQINLGEFLMNAFIKFSTTKADLNPLIIYATNLQLQ